MGPRDLLRLVSGELTGLGIRHFVTGSMGSMAYGEYRSTIDVDLVADLRPSHLKALATAFQEPDFYLSESAMREALKTFGQFNLIHVPSAMKVDFMIPEPSAFNVSRFERVRQVPLAEGVTVPVASPEDIILMKLRYFTSGGSDKHLRDIAGMLRVMREQVDRGYIERWARDLGVTDSWLAVANASS